MMYDVLQHYNDNCRSPGSWCLLLMSLLAENNSQSMCTQAIRQKIQLTLILKDLKVAERQVASSHVPTLKHEAKHGYITQKWPFQMLHETNKHLFPGYISVCSFMF